MDKFKVIIEQNEKGEFSVEIIDYLSKTKDTWNHSDIKKGLEVVGSPIWCMDRFITKLKPVFRGVETETDDSPFS